MKTEKSSNLVDCMPIMDWVVKLLVCFAERLAVVPLGVRALLFQLWDLGFGLVGLAGV